MCQLLNPKTDNMKGREKVWVEWSEKERDVAKHKIFIHLSRNRERSMDGNIKTASGDCV